MENKDQQRFIEDAKQQETEGTKYQCPECTKMIYQHELDMFGGVCEDCREEMNQLNNQKDEYKG